MTNRACEFIDFWIENSVHAGELQGSTGAEQRVSVLAGRCLEMASSVGLSRAALEQEVGDLPVYISAKLAAANQVERDRRV